jgi:hypothetical protein
MTYGFSYHDRANADVVARTLGFATAKIVSIEGNKWRIAFDDGKHHSHGSKGVPATQLRAWIDGALSVAGFAQGRLDEATKMRAETVAGLVPEGDDLINALYRECESGDADTTYMTQKLFPYMDGTALTQHDITDIAEGADLHVFTEEQLQEERESTIEAAIEDHPLFRQAVRVAYARNERERQDDIRELTHILARDWNAYNQAALI